MSRHSRYTTQEDPRYEDIISEEKVSGLSDTNTNRTGPHHFDTPGREHHYDTRPPGSGQQHGGHDGNQTVRDVYCADLEPEELASDTESTQSTRSSLSGTNAYYASQRSGPMQHAASQVSFAQPPFVRAASGTPRNADLRREQPPSQASRYAGQQTSPRGRTAEEAYISLSTRARVGETRSQAPSSRAGPGSQIWPGSSVSQDPHRRYTSIGAQLPGHARGVESSRMNKDYDPAQVFTTKQPLTSAAAVTSKGQTDQVAKHERARHREHRRHRPCKPICQQHFDYCISQSRLHPGHRGYLQGLWHLLLGKPYVKHDTPERLDLLNRANNSIGRGILGRLPGLKKAGFRDEMILVTRSLLKQERHTKRAMRGGEDHKDHTHDRHGRCSH